MNNTLNVTNMTMLAAEGVSSEGFLETLGERLRSLRAERGMTRKNLSAESGVSERYLAQMESGQGNVSIILLRQIAQAMRISLEALVRETPEPEAELKLAIELLSRLTAGQLVDARALLNNRFGDNGDRTGRVALIGLRGAGKSTIGRALAAQAGVPFVQLKSEVARLAGMDTAEIFDLLGQGSYRRMEREALERLLEIHPRMVLETSGGVVSETATFERLLSACTTVWLRTTPEDHMARVVAQGDHRPMAGNKEALADLKNILAARAAFYGKADHLLDTNGKSVDDCVSELLDCLVGLAK